jgi:glycosyltransferase involved in cell wall biosynthesis
MQIPLMPALRILHVAPYGGDAWAYGGIPRLARAMTVGLARRGHHVTLVTTDACDATSRLQQHAGRPRRARASQIVDGVHVEIFPNLSNRTAYHWQLFMPLGLAAFMRRHAGSFDVAHLHACRNLPGAIAAYYLERARVPYVIAPNGTAPLMERRRYAKRAFDLVAGRRVLRQAHRVIAVSQAETRQLQPLGVPDDRVRVIPNPIDLDEFAAPVRRGYLRRAHGLSDAPLVLYLGKLTPRKRVDDLVRAFARLRRTDARLVIAGNDMGSGARIRRLVAQLGLEQRTTFTGLLRGAARLEALADADVVAYPAEHEIFGLVPLEALLAGTPAIVADDSGCAEVISAVGGGLVVGLGDVGRLARAIDDVLTAPTLWRTQAGEAAARVRSGFGSDRVCGRLSELYEELVTSA